MSKEVEIKPGKGLLAQIEDGNKTTYKPLTYNVLRESLKEFYLAPLREQLKMELSNLLKRSLVTEEKQSNLIQMIDSKDEESIRLAEEIIKVKNYGLNI